MEVPQKIKNRTTMCMLSHSRLWTVAHQAPLSMGFSRQEYWSELPCTPPGDLPDPGIELMSPISPALAGGFFTTSATREAPQNYHTVHQFHFWVFIQRK